MNLKILKEKSRMDKYNLIIYIFNSILKNHIFINQKKSYIYIKNENIKLFSQTEYFIY